MSDKAATKTDPLLDHFMRALQEDVDPKDSNLSLPEVLKSRNQRGSWDFVGIVSLEDECFDPSNHGSNVTTCMQIITVATEMAREIARTRKLVAEAKEQE